MSVVAVLTQPDRPSGRGLKRTASAVSALAAEADLPLLQPARLDRPALDAIASYRPALLVVAAYGLLLPAELLKLPDAGAINLHASLLPRYRGAAPIQHALLEGAHQTGISFMLMDEGLDTGPVLRRYSLDIQSEWDAGELTGQLARLGAEHLPTLVADWMAGRVSPQPQPEQGVSLAPSLKPADARLDWRRDAAALSRQVRAFSPTPGAWSLAGDKRLKVLRAREIQAPSSAERPGLLFNPAKARLAVVCGGGSALELLLLQPEGSRAMPARDLLNGHRPELSPGVVLPLVEQRPA